MRKLFIFNTTILTGGAGVYRLTPLTLEKARAVVSVYDQLGDEGEIKSAIGHASTAQIVSTLLGRPVAFCRDAVTQEVGSQALCFKVNGRPPEGVILSVEEIEKIGYQWFLLEMEAEGAAEERGATAAIEQLMKDLEERRRTINVCGTNFLLKKISEAQGSAEPR